MNCAKHTSVTEICRHLGSPLSNILINLSENQIEKLCEIRIKADLPVILIFTDSKQFITKSERLTQIYSDSLLKISSNDLDRIFCSMCDYSVHSHAQSISNGFISLQSGCRVGVYGTAVLQNGKINSVRNIRGMNIRISGEFSGCANEIIENCFDGVINNILICGPPACGKTTVLKSLCRTLSDDLSRKTAVIDERCEMSSSYLGYNSDVLSGYPKADGISIALRTLSPEIIVFDELGRKEEVLGIIETLNSGVNFISSIHCKNETELYSKEQFRMLNAVNAVDYCVFIGGNFKIQKIVRVNRNENFCIDNSRHLLCDDRTIHIV